ncbi:hypothetical protein NDN08_005987 [Rhodosorus marinus]|uniref:Uncharacterized protein n=1 Tax=Rhodosorus marinus TaxID=101924 RepID=A0AAV8UN99_9RHOD|nr:hypothetical protein NDN08_005987 [Rhodosorus marinus]
MLTYRRGQHQVYLMPKSLESREGGLGAAIDWRAVAISERFHSYFHATEPYQALHNESADMVHRKALQDLEPCSRTVIPWGPPPLLAGNQASRGHIFSDSVQILKNSDQISTGT